MNSSCECPTANSCGYIESNNQMNYRIVWSIEVKLHINFKNDAEKMVDTVNENDIN